MLKLSRNSLLILGLLFVGCGSDESKTPSVPGVTEEEIVLANTNAVQSAGTEFSLSLDSREAIT